MSKFSEYIETQKMYEDLGEKLRKAQDDFEKTIPLQSLRKRYWYLNDTNSIRDSKWNGSYIDLDRYNSGNVFESDEQVEKERLKRELIAKIGLFRKECYGDWQPDWNNLEENKYTFMNDGKFLWVHKTEIDLFSIFGYFRHHDVCKQALDLFGKDIEKLMNYEK